MDNNYEDIEALDNIVMSSYDEAKRMGAFFLERFLAKLVFIKKNF